MKKILIAILFSFGISFSCSAQISSSRVGDMVRIDNNTLMKQTEVTLQEWIGFMVNNDLDGSLFPNTACMTRSEKLLFDDLKKGGDPEYIKITENHGMTREVVGDKSVEVTKNF